MLDDVPPPAVAVFTKKRTALFVVLTLALLVVVERFGLTDRRANKLGFASGTLRAKQRQQQSNSTVNHQPPPHNNNEKIPMWFVWLGSNPLKGVHLAAIESCRKHNQETFDIRLVRDEELAHPSSLLGFDLHPMFHLLDHVQKSDYLRQELLHFHGGIYLDADVFCLKSLAHTLDKIRPQKEGNATKPVGGGNPSETDRNNNNFGNNMLGPFLKNSSYTTATHNELWTIMDGLEDQLLQCAKDHPDGKGGIAYPQHIKHDFQICGTPWGVLIDFNNERTRQAYDAGLLVKTLEECRPDSEPSSCDLLHLGCAFSQRDCHDPKSLCPEYPILKKAGLWSC